MERMWDLSGRLGSPLRVRSPSGGCRDRQAGAGVVRSRPGRCRVRQEGAGVVRSRPGRCRVRQEGAGVVRSRPGRCRVRQEGAGVVRSRPGRCRVRQEGAGVVRNRPGRCRVRQEGAGVVRSRPGSPQGGVESLRGQERESPEDRGGSWELPLMKESFWLVGVRRWMAGGVAQWSSVHSPKAGDGVAIQAVASGLACSGGGE